MYNMNAVRPDFVGKFSNTYGYFFPPAQYEAKKDTIIKSLTDSLELGKKGDLILKHYKDRVDILLNTLKIKLCEADNENYTYKKYVQYLEEQLGIKYTVSKLARSVRNGRDIPPAKHMKEWQKL